MARQTFIVGWMLVTVVALIGVGWIAWALCTEHAPFDVEQKHAMIRVPDIPDFSSSPYVNTSGAATFVGRSSCAACHPDIDHGYRETAHSRALEPVVVDNEPPEGEFFASRSRRHYRVYRKGEELWHEESIQARDAEKVVLTEHPMRWAIGSGRFSRSYLAECDGFLVESPVTWYAARPGWDLSPGYERRNSGFERPAEIRCILCHVGRAEPIEGSDHRIQILGGAIDCERCHGAGSLHEAYHLAGEKVLHLDRTIVHPGRLDRQRSEAICAQCHLHSAAMVDIRGRRLADFRPGLPLNDFAIAYGLESPSDKMHVVGHMEQMQLSRCYQASGALTCITCHDPHQHASSTAQRREYRSICLDCHAQQDCRVDIADHSRIDVNDNCVICHMPTSPTEIPHFAFTHHRIGIHTPDSAPDNGSAHVQALIPLVDVSHLSQIDQDRSLGLAYMQVADLPEHVQHAVTYHDQARQLLERVRRHGLRDSAVDAALARLYWQGDPKRTIAMAESVLSAPNPSPDERATALFTLGTTLFQQNDFERATVLFEDLVTIRRYSDAWGALSICREELGNLDGAVAAAEQAAQISPDRIDFQQRLVRLYQLLNRPKLVDQHETRARQLLEVFGSQ